MATDITANIVITGSKDPNHQPRTPMDKPKTQLPTAVVNLIHLQLNRMCFNALLPGANLLREIDEVLEALNERAVMFESFRKVPRV